MTISVQIFLFSSLLLSVFFGTSDCEIVLEIGDIAVFFCDERVVANCVKYNGNNYDLGVGVLIRKMSTKHRRYKDFVNNADDEGRYSLEDSEKIHDIIELDTCFPFLNILR
ncbi:uncharacterized protein LOC126840718 [Adelges cooleyi]|uniref:uncharacterized protein LOC126840718 n=1 Tax=Adelges cooleyi TaxID=133065 RepID=UPI00217FC1C4|nr:uncharacterized protein LOC126840718 [Adelges cooleyi]XP_050432589.1 uncharacterized protein LOC126840718 [Adelges cooleyi]XP_050432591.1 uncharacterized protein LOC126840718 [Adelges cooleyi]